MKSKIIAEEEKYDQNEFAELAMRISDKFTLIKYEDLINAIRAKKEEEKEIEEKKTINNLFPLLLVKISLLLLSQS